MNQNYNLQSLNKNNVYITDEDIKTILIRYGINIKINNLDLYQKAFIHRSYLIILNKEQSKEEIENEKLIKIEESNERLELLGDCILGCIVGTYLFTRFSDKTEGELTQLKIKIIRRRTLAFLGRKMNLGKYIIITQHVESEGGRDCDRILEDLFECFIGALYLDNQSSQIDSEWFNNIILIKEIEKKLELLEQNMTDINHYIYLNKQYRDLINLILTDKSNGFYICQKFIINVIENELDLIKLLTENDNYKAELQQYFHKYYKNIAPKWDILTIDGPTNNRLYTMCIKDDKGEIIGIGRAKKKIDAEQLASKEALINLGVLDVEL
jgi:dsRNA-specific ribonuclease